jgi:zinc protease
LGNGITLIVRPAQISDSVFVYGSVHNSPPLQEPPGKEGVASVLEAMFAYGTETRDREAFVRAQDDLDSQIGGGAEFSMQTTSASFGKAVALLAENELHPRLDAATFQIAQRRVLEAVETAQNSTGAIAQISLDKKLLPAGDPTLRQATPDTVQALTLDDVRAYYASVFRPDLTTIVVAGATTPDAAQSSIGGAFGGWKSTGAPPNLELPPVPLNQPGDVRMTIPALGQDDVTLTELLSVDRSTPQFAALQLGNTILGGGSLGAEQSRLFRDIRQNAGLVYSIDSRIAGQKTRTQLSVDFASSPANHDRIEQMINAEIVRMQTEQVGDFELSLARAATARRTLVDLSSLSDIGQALLGDAQGGYPLDRDRLDAQAIIATSAQAVKEAFAALVRPAGFVKVVIGP